MRCIIHKNVGFFHPPDGPLAAYISPFAASLDAQGYNPKTWQKQILVAAGFSQWLKRTRTNVSDIDTEHAVRYLRCRARRVRLWSGDLAALERFITFLRSENVIPAAKPPATKLTPVERYVQAYEQYLLDVRGLAPTTIVSYMPFVRNFLTKQFGPGRVSIPKLRATDVIQFVQEQAPKLHVKRARGMTTALRSLLQYASYRGNATSHLQAAVPTVANWSMQSIPRAIAADQVLQLLATIDRSSARGRRNYAILLLLARLGLRASEVAFLELDDIDWNTGTLIVRGVGDGDRELPLPEDVGNAVAAYLRYGRPDNTSRRLFLRTRAPITGFRGHGAIGTIVRHSIVRAGIASPTKGAHQFRHGLATEMLRCGASLSEIGELLRHRHPRTTTIYAKVHLDALRTLAVPWPGGV